MPALRNLPKAMRRRIALQSTSREIYEDAVTVSSRSSGLWECARVLASLSQNHRASAFARCSICSSVGSVLLIQSRASLI